MLLHSIRAVCGWLGWELRWILMGWAGLAHPTAPAGSRAAGGQLGTAPAPGIRHVPAEGDGRRGDQRVSLWVSPAQQGRWPHRAVVEQEVNIPWHRWGWCPQGNWNGVLGQKLISWAAYPTFIYCSQLHSYLSVINSNWRQLLVCLFVYLFLWQERGPGSQAMPMVSSEPWHAVASPCSEMTLQRYVCSSRNVQPFKKGALLMHVGVWWFIFKFLKWRGPTCYR